MLWHQLSWECDEQVADAACAWLEARGAVSVTLEGAVDVPLYEPAPGTTPIWPRTRLIALFDQEHLVPGLIDALPAAFPGQGGRATTAILAERVWEREWLTRFKPMRFGKRLWVCPGGQRPPAPEAGNLAQVIVELDPGLAFGTGTHPTTAMCLAWLDSLGIGTTTESPGLASGPDNTRLASGLDGAHCIDFGCGSGILAIAALKLGAAHATAVDIDPQALNATVENARRNGVDGVLNACTPQELPGDIGGECVLANILAGQLETLAPRLARLTAPGGALALSGVLVEQARAVSAVYEPWFDERSVEQFGQWVLIVLQRRGG
ncbi:MAG: 50S ribosomal protein L11 methyltransferase [Gammaproteobacteria bacterium]